MAAPTSNNNPVLRGGGKAPTAAAPRVGPTAPEQGGFDSSSVKRPGNIPESFWQSILHRTANAPGIKWLMDPTKGGGFDRFKSKADYLKFLQQGATEEFGLLPEQQKQEFVDADATGGVDPNSVEGHVQTSNKLIDDAEALDQADFAGIDPTEFENATRGAAAGDQAALAHLNELISGIKDPAIKEYVGDYAAHLSGADPRDIEAQQRQLAKLEGLSDPTITAEEKLMMEMSRRQTESDLKGQRGAIANNLQARGVYGSGAELTMNLAAQQEAAQRQALEMLGAQSNAQTRAMESLKGAADLSTSMRGSSAQESQDNATAMNQAEEFNKNMREAYTSWKDKTEKENSDRAIARGEKIASNVGQIGKSDVQAAGSIYDFGADRAANRSATRGKYLKPRLDLEGTELNDDDRDKTEEKL